MTLAELIKQTHFASPAQEAHLNVLATASWLSSLMTETLAPYGITPAQYNVLRILRGHAPEPYACSEIAQRLLDRTPDVTRLLVRLERQGLITRTRAAHDRRVVLVHITERGLELLAQLDEPVRERVDHTGRHLTDDELSMLSALLERLRTDQT
ncbi:MAG: MarR family winged helix-turn-helix transcriptional regulator [Rubricoccaceae bacterium]